MHKTACRQTQAWPQWTELGLGRGQGGVAGLVGGRQGWVAGQVGWQAGSGGGQGQVAGQVIGGGWILGVNNVLVRTQRHRIFNHLHRIFDFTKEKCILM